MAASAASEFQSLIHPEDRAAAAQAAARAFWNGIPRSSALRMLQLDGSYRATAFRAEPGYGVPVAVEAMVQRPDEPWTTSASLGETGAAVEAAKVIEQLHGAAFAFDAAGIFTYATPVAQTSIAMTLDDLNRPLDGRPFIEGGDLGWKLGVHPDDYGLAAARLRTCLRTGEDFNYDYRVLRATGDECLAPLRDPADPCRRRQDHRLVWHRHRHRRLQEDRRRRFATASGSSG